MLGLFRRVSVVCVLGAGLAACAGGGSPLMSPSPTAGQYKVGQPYEVGGEWYTPREQSDYDETGVASWYGPTFYGHRTADGEIFNAGDMTAAHPTLPMPVYVRVTDLDNGRSAILRVNDRGPYANNRIIDVSEHAAEVLGFKRAGTAHVRVQYVGRADNGAPPPAEEDDSGATVMAANTPAETSPGADVGDTAADAAEATQTAALNAASAGGTVVADAATAAAPVAVAPAIPLPAPDAQAPPGDDEAADDQSGPPATDDSGSSAADAQTASAPVDVAPLEAGSQETAQGDSAEQGPQQVPADPSPPVVAQADPPPPPAPAAVHPAAAPPARNHLYVQAGAFASRDNANHLIAMLASVGSFFVSPIEKAGAELYRVRSGPFDDLAAANAALARLTGLGNSSARIVSDP